MGKFTAEQNFAELWKDEIYPTGKDDQADYTELY